MPAEDDATPGIIVPGPELRMKIERTAASLAKRDKRKAEEMMAKVLASQKREEFLFFEMTHVFYPFFLQKLNEFRTYPELMPTEKDSTSKTSNTVTTTVKPGGIVRREGGTRREEVLRQAEVEAQRYLEDPFPNKYSLDLLHGTVDMSALTLSYMTCTAQYIAKYGEQFLQDLRTRYVNNAAFRFLNSEDVRHGVLLKLIESYRRILNHDPEEVEDRLERYDSPRYVIDKICAEKARYARAAIARQKAALLTDDELRDKLEWNIFTVVQNFSLNDLSLDGPVPAGAAARRRAQHEGVSTIALTTASPSTTNGSSADASTPATVTPRGVKDVQEDGSHMVRPPTGMMAPPAFKPSFISSTLVNSVDPTAPPANGGGRV
ncbi:putative Surp module [Trypanosoma vivax]|nr:putative Surp module [Trypanosoma vivax]